MLSGTALPRARPVHRDEHFAGRENFTSLAFGQIFDLPIELVERGGASGRDYGALGSRHGFRCNRPAR
jgi:hypothetical protein